MIPPDPPDSPAPASPSSPDSLTGGWDPLLSSLKVPLTKRPSIKETDVKKMNQQFKTDVLNSQMHRLTETEDTKTGREKMKTVVRKVMLFADVQNQTPIKSTRSVGQLTNDPELVAHSHCIIYPNSLTKQKWDIWVACLLMFQMFFVPLRLGFLNGLKYDIIDGCCDSFFLVDIVLNFFVAYIDLDAGWVINKRLIARKYIRGWFFLDLLATFPFYLIGRGFGRVLKMSRALKMLRLSRLVKLLRVARVEVKLRKMLEDKPNGIASLYRIVKVFFIVCLVAHWSACVGYFLAISLLPVDSGGFACCDEEGNKYPLSWVVIQEGFHTDPKEINLMKLYIASLYWAWATLSSVGYGDIAPISNAERLFSCGIMLCGVAFLAYATATLTSVMNTQDLADSKYRDQGKLLDHFLHKVSLPPALEKRVKLHFRYSLRAELNIEEFRKILSQMPSHLQTSVAHTINRHIVRQVPFLKLFADKDPYFVTQFFAHVHLARYVPCEFIGLCGEVVREMFIVKMGKIFRLDSKGRKHGTVFSGDSFGQIGIACRDKWTYSYFTTMETTVLAISRKRLQKILKDHPVAYREFIRYAKRMEKELKGTTKDNSGKIAKKTMRSYMSIGAGFERPTNNQYLLTDADLLECHSVAISHRSSGLHLDNETMSKATKEKGERGAEDDGESTELASLSDKGNLKIPKEFQAMPKKLPSRKALAPPAQDIRSDLLSDVLNKVTELKQNQRELLHQQQEIQSILAERAARAVFE